MLKSHIGSIIFSSTLDTEAKVKAIYGGNSWARIEGKFLLGASDNYAINSEGGEATHVLSVEEMPSHSHGYPGQVMGVKWSSDTSGYMVYNGTHNMPTTWNTGGSQAHNNMPPYKTVYIWERVA